MRDEGTPKEGGHECKQPSAALDGACGSAIYECYEDVAGRLWVDNSEYASQVNYCPICGFAAPTTIEGA